jgi:hypothetical protein
MMCKIISHSNAFKHKQSENKAKNLHVVATARRLDSTRRDVWPGRVDLQKVMTSPQNW